MTQDEGRDGAQAVDAGAFDRIIVDESTVLHPQPPGNRPEIATVARIGQGYLAERYPRLAGALEWSLCGGFIVRIDAARATLAFRLPKWPYLGLLVVETGQDESNLRQLQASTTTDGLTANGRFGSPGGAAMTGEVAPFDETALIRKTSAPIVLFPDWDQASFDMLATFGVRVRT